MSDLPSLKIFLSSPGDVGREREMAHRVIRRLNEQFSNRVHLDPYFWEHEPMRATQDFQQQIPEPAQFDLVICILWSRLGTRLHASHKRADGTSYNSGTEYEFENAAEAAMKKGTPELMVYWNQKPPLIPLKPKELRDEMTRQFDALEAFVQRWFFDQEDKGTLKAAFNTYEDLAEFEEKLEVHLSKLVEAKYPPTAETASLPQATWKKGSPFRGLQVFDFEHEEIFFGRTTAIGEILEALRRRIFDREPTFLLVQGNSGVGKSSVVRAGVLPLLIKPGVVEGVGAWRRAVMRPAEAAGNPALSLARALVATHALPELTADGSTVEYLAELLETNPDNAFLIIKGALSQVGQKIALEENLESQPVAKLVLLVDQFEEIFTTDDLSPKNRESLVAVMRSLANSGLVWVIATMRSDFFHRCDEIPALVELKAGLGQYQLVPPSPAEISQIIRKPAQIAGLRFEVNSQTGEQLDDLLRDAAVKNPTSLPLLEFCLEELYQRRNDQNILTLASYAEIGGVEGALAKRAEEAFSSTSPNAQNQFDAVFRQLVTVTPGEETSVTRRTEQLEAFAQQSAQKELVDALIEERLLVSGLNEAGVPVVSVAHEALLRSWPRLQSWIDSSMEFFRERFRLEYSLNRWKDEGQTDELLLREGKPLASAEALVNQWSDYLRAEEIAYVEHSIAHHKQRALRRIRRLQVTLAGFAILFVLSAITGVFALQQKSQAEAEKQRAEDAATEAENQRILAEQAALEAQRQEGIAREQTRKSIETTLQIQEGNFRLAFDRKEFSDSIFWLEQARATAEELGQSTGKYGAWQATLYPRITQVSWENGYGTTITDLDVTSTGEEVYVLFNNQFYHADLTVDSPRFAPILFKHGVRTIDSFVVDEENQRLLYTDEKSVFAFSLEGDNSTATETVLEGLAGGIFNVENSKDIWFVRNGEVEIWSPDLSTKLESFPYPYVENGYVYIGILDRERGTLAAKIGAGDDRLIHVINYKTGEVIRRQDRQGGFFQSLVLSEDYYLSNGSGGSENQARLTILDADDPTQATIVKTPWSMRNIVEWDDSGFWTSCADGALRQWGFDGTLLDTRRLPGIPFLNHCIRLPKGYLISTSDRLIYTPDLELAGEAYASLTKPPSKSLIQDGSSFWSLSQGYLDRMDPASGEVLTSIQIDLEQATLGIFGDYLYGYRDGEILQFALDPAVTEFTGETPYQLTENDLDLRRTTSVKGVKELVAGAYSILALTDTGTRILDSGTLKTQAHVGESSPETAIFLNDDEALIATFNTAKKQVELQAVFSPFWARSNILVLPVDPEIITAVTMGPQSPLIGLKDGRVLRLNLEDESVYESLYSRQFLKQDEVIASSTALEEVFQSESGEVTALATFPFSFIVVAAFDDGSVKVIDTERRQGSLIATLYPFPRNDVKAIFPLSPDIFPDIPEGILFQSTANELVSMSFGSASDYISGENHVFGMGRGAFTGTHVLYPRGTHIEAFYPPTLESYRLIPGSRNIGESNLNTAVINPALDRLVAYSSGNLFNWTRTPDGEWEEYASELPLDIGILGSSMEFIDNRHLVVGSPNSEDPLIMLLEFEAGSDDPITRFRASMSDLNIRESKPRYVAGNRDYLFFGDDESNVIWRVSIEDRSVQQIKGSGIPRRLSMAGADQGTLVVSHEGYVMLYEDSGMGAPRRVEFPRIGVTGEDYYIREMLPVPDTDFLFGGYENTILLIDVRQKEVLIHLPAQGYVWELNLDPRSNSLFYISNTGIGKIPFRDLSRTADAPAPILVRGRSSTGEATLYSDTQEVVHYE